MSDNRYLNNKREGQYFTDFRLGQLSLDEERKSNPESRWVASRADTKGLEIILRSNRFRAIGVDVERVNRWQEWSDCEVSAMHRILKVPKDSELLHPKALLGRWVAREAVYKAFNYLYGGIEFGDLTYDDTFRATVFEDESYIYAICLIEYEDDNNEKAHNRRQD